MSQTNSEYWEQRIANNTWSVYNSLEEKNRALLEMYQEASLNIQEELYQVAKKINDGKGISLSDMHKFNRLKALEGNFETIMRKLGEDVEKFGKDSMKEGFNKVYSNVMTELGQTDFALPNEKLMEEMMNRPWEGSTFSQRLWKNTQVLASNLNELLTVGLQQGKTVTEIAINLNNRMNTGFNVSHRLVRTETMHYLNESASKAYEDGGCKEVQIWAAIDERTCPTCGGKHGNIYNMKDRPVLPLHSHCRCTYLPVIDKDDAKKDHDKAKQDIKNELDRRKNIGYKYTDDGIIKVTEDHKGEHYTIPKKHKPYSVIETSKVYKNGYEQIDRTYYDKRGNMYIQIHSGNHNQPKQHPYGENGEHTHIYTWDKNGNRKSRDTRELTKEEIKQNQDILRRGNK
jgi:SPP1 gp7 family putative phage head morphogenesis protein